MPCPLAMPFNGGPPDGSARRAIAKSGKFCGLSTRSPNTRD
jgi:hypothetical protein